jgi:hypothetical protein
MSEIEKYQPENLDPSHVSQMLVMCFATLPKFGEANSADRLRGWMISLQGENVSGSEIEAFTAHWMKNGTRIPIPSDFFSWRTEVRRKLEAERLEGIALLKMATEEEKHRQWKEEREAEERAEAEREEREAKSKGMTVEQLRASRMKRITDRLKMIFSIPSEFASSKYAGSKPVNDQDLIITEDDRRKFEEAKRRLRAMEGGEA